MQYAACLPIYQTMATETDKTMDSTMTNLKAGPPALPRTHTFTLFCSCLYNP